MALWVSCFGFCEGEKYDTKRFPREVVGRGAVLVLVPFSPAAGGVEGETLAKGFENRRGIVTMDARK